MVSRNDADTGLRIFNSIEELRLDISRAAFASGADPCPYLDAFSCDLFLSSEPAAVRSALASGHAAARIMAPPESTDELPAGPVHIAFDGDAVLFDQESELVYQRDGLDAFAARERELSEVPLPPGPFEPFLRSLGRLQNAIDHTEPVIRTSLVTARSAPSHARAVKTLRTWDVQIDEAFFLGGVAKAGVLKALQPHIFFDDQDVHLRDSRRDTPSAQVL